MPADPPDLPTPSATERVPVGRYALIVGDSAGLAIEPVEGQGTLPALAEAVAHDSRETKGLAGRAAAFEGAVEDVSQEMGKVEQALKRATELMQAGTDPAALSDEIGVLLDVLARLDHDEHWTEALRVARTLVMLLALLGRWLDLLEALQTALGAAERLGDLAGQAWALHEQGTLHLAAGENAGANRLLGHAHDLRKQIGDRRALALTNRNVQVLCQALRAELELGGQSGGGVQSGDGGGEDESLLQWLQQKPIAAAAMAVASLLLGGVAGALINGTGRAPLTLTTPAVTVTKPAATVTVRITKTGPGPAKTITTEQTTLPPPTPTSKLSVTVTGPGTISSGDGTIDCSLSCSHSYKTGATVKLSPAPSEEGGRFTEWRGDCTGMGSCSLTMNTDKSVTAVFAPPPATLTVTPTGEGRGTVRSSDEQIDCGMQCSHVYLHETTVTLTAVADAGFRFGGWGSPCSGEGQCTVAIDKDTKVSAEFVPTTGLR